MRFVSIYEACTLFPFVGCFSRLIFIAFTMCSFCILTPTVDFYDTRLPSRVKRRNSREDADASWRRSNCGFFKLNTEPYPTSSPSSEADTMATRRLDNHYLLWHGTSMANVISILARGLLVAPADVPITGHLFGEVSHSSPPCGQSCAWS